MRMIQNLYLRRLVFTLGWLCVFAGLIGVFIPLWPTTPFLLAAAWCFFRSSPKAYVWLRTRPHLGAAITDWEERGAIATRTKALALSTMAGSMAILWLIVPLMWVKVSVSALLILVSAFLLTGPPA